MALQLADNSWYAEGPPFRAQLAVWGCKGGEMKVVEGAERLQHVEHVVAGIIHGAKAAHVWPLSLVLWRPHLCLHLRQSILQHAQQQLAQDGLQHCNPL
jgi:hypothetical protein